MQKIQPAPKLQDLLTKYRYDANVMAKVLNMSADHLEEYRHWHKLKYITPPEGIDSEAWWLAKKIARNAAKKMLPFDDEHGERFSYVLTDRILERLHTIDSNARGTLGSNKTAHTEHATQYIAMSLVEEAITSSQLEGALTTRKIARDMIRIGRAPRDRNERMIYNNYRAMEHIRDSLNQPLTFDRLMLLHKILTQHTLDDSNDCGRIQTQNEKRVMIADPFGKVFFRPPPAELLPDRLGKLIAFANQSGNDGGFLHPILRAITLHFMTGFYHPFVDGNGRVARALFYYSALKDGYDSFAFLSISKMILRAPAQYAYAYQYVETDENDMTYFFHNQLDVICKSIKELEKYVAKKQLQINRIRKDLKKLSLNYRQLALLSHAANHPRHVYTTIAHKNSHGCAYATARADLLNLAELALLKKFHIDKKSLGFVSPDDLDMRISQLAKS